jgi:AcrR family transcriptional regulator
MAHAPITERGRRTRRRIVDAALGVVADRGANGASLDEVGARAGTSKSQMYHYFSDRDDLVRAVAEATNEMVLAAQSELFAGLGTAAGLAAWADALVELNQARHGAGGCPIASLVAQVGEHDQGARTVLAAGFDRWEAALRSGLEAQRDCGQLRDDADTAWLATCVLASVQGGLVLAQAGRNPAALRAALDGALALVDSHRPRRTRR